MRPDGAALRITLGAVRERVFHRARIGLDDVVSVAERLRQALLADLSRLGGHSWILQALE